LHVFLTGLMTKINDNAKPVVRQGRKTAGLIKINCTSGTWITSASVTKLPINIESDIIVSYIFFVY